MSELSDVVSFTEQMGTVTSKLIADNFNWSIVKAAHYIIDMRDMDLIKFVKEIPPRGRTGRRFKQWEYLK